MKPEKIPHGWRSCFPAMEKAFRSMGMYEAADRARMKFEATERALAAGFDHVLDCEWYDRGRSQIPLLNQDERGGNCVVYFGQISVALQRDQMLMLWALLTVAMFPQGMDALRCMNDLVAVCYDDEGDLKSEFFQNEAES